MVTAWTPTLYADERDEAAALVLLAGHGLVLAEVDAWLADERLPAAARELGRVRRMEMVEAALTGSEDAVAFAAAYFHQVMSGDRRQRNAAEKKARGGQAARERSKIARAVQAAQDATVVAGLFRRAYCAGMGRVALQAAAMQKLAQQEERLKERLTTVQQAGNKPETRRLSAELQGLERQRTRCTRHYAGRWLQQQRESG